MTAGPGKQAQYSAVIFYWRSNSSLQKNFEKTNNKLISSQPNQIILSDHGKNMTFFKESVLYRAVLVFVLLLTALAWLEVQTDPDGRYR